MSHNNFKQHFSKQPPEPKSLLDFPELFQEKPLTNNANEGLSSYKLGKHPFADMNNKNFQIAKKMDIIRRNIKNIHSGAQKKKQPLEKGGNTVFQGQPCKTNTIILFQVILLLDEE